MTSKISVTYQSCRSAGVFLFTQDFLVFLNSLQFNKQIQFRMRGGGKRSLAEKIKHYNKSVDCIFD